MKKIIPKIEECMECTGVVGSPKKSKEPKKCYPQIQLKHEFIPETKNWEVGKMYKIELEIKMTGLSISKFQNDSEFEIHGYDLKGESKNNKEDEE